MDFRNAVKRMKRAWGVVVGGVLWLGADGRGGEAPWYRFQPDEHSRWSSPENPNGRQGAGAKENHGAKGRAFVPLKAGEAHTLLEVSGAGVITRIWMTVMDRSPEMLRSLKVEMFWDGAKTPAVAAPLGDFFGVGLGRTAKFHNAFFASPEGRSFTCLIPMPYRTGARIRITNESGKDLSHLFYDVDFLETPRRDEADLYFHAHWRRERATELGKDFEILPRVEGRGRYLGANIGVNANARYEDTWWGEGEVKVYLNNDDKHPTLAGTGTEDYIGTGWGQGEFATPFSGSLVADEKEKQWAFYRFHVPDPVWFETGCRVTLQQIGGAMKEKVAKLQRAGVPLIPVTIDVVGELRHLHDPGKITDLATADLPDGWINFYRSDDVSAVAYFYLDRPENGLPALPAVGERGGK